MYTVVIDNAPLTCECVALFLDIDCFVASQPASQPSNQGGRHLTKTAVSDTGDRGTLLLGSDGQSVLGPRKGAIKSALSILPCADERGRKAGTIASVVGLAPKL